MAKSKKVSEADGRFPVQDAERSKAAHERMNGPWDEWDLEEGARNVSRADQISKNPKFMDAIKKHAEKKAEEHQATAHRMEMLRKSGKISDKAAEKLRDKR